MERGFYWVKGWNGKPTIIRVLSEERGYDMLGDERSFWNFDDLVVIEKIEEPSMEPDTKGDE